MSSLTAAPALLTTTRALCAEDPERMHPVAESQRSRQEPTAGERHALAVCYRCPLLASCREAVLTVAPLPYGVAGGMTAMQRRAARATRRGLDTSQTPPAPTRTAPALPALTATVAPAVATVLGAQRSPGARTADRVTVDRLAAGRPVATASRWEVATAAAAMLLGGASVAAVARSLGEQQRQVQRWRDRYRTGQPLVCAPPGHESTVGTGQLHRPQHPTTRRAPASETRTAA